MSRVVLSDVTISFQIQQFSGGKLIFLDFSQKTSVLKELNTDHLLGSSILRLI
jgi:hypothetical protein